MAYKVSKHYAKYAIVKSEWDEYFLVDVLNSQTISYGWNFTYMKHQAEALESGAKTLESFNTKYNSAYCQPIDMPKSLKTKQAQLQKQAAAQAAHDAQAAKYAIVEKDGKYLLVDTQTSKALIGNNTAVGAKSWADLLEDGSLGVEDLKLSKNYMEYVDLKNAKIVDTVGVAKPIGSKAPSIVEVTDKGAYKIVKLSDGTYGMFHQATGASKLGFDSKLGASLSGSNAAKKHATEILASQGVNPGASAVDTLIELYDGRVREMYGQAYREMAAKQAKFLERFAEADAEMVAKKDAGDITAKQLKEWRSSQSAIAARNTQMVDSLAYTLSNADKKAMAMLNGYMGPAYAENMAYATYQIEKQAGISTSFTLYNQNAVDNILKNPDIQLLPEHDDAKDMAWCRKKVSSCTAQSILQGESIPHASQRLQTVVGMSANSAVRAARTALTGAQNLGTLDAAKRAQALGIDLEMEWMATPDDRTRPSHRDADGQRQKVGDYFIVGIAKLEYPGDPGGGDEAWNCRCTLLPRVKGVDMSDAERWSRLPEGMTYDDWKNEHSLAEKAKAEKLQAKMNEIDAKKAEITKALPNDAKYEKGELLKHETSLSKWEQEGAAIAESKAYCEKKLDEAMKHFSPADGDFDSWQWADKATHYQKKLDAINAFDREGKAYHDAKMAVQGQLDALDKQKKELGAQLSKLNGNAGPYSQERLDAARKFTSKQEADDALRALSGKAWQEATQAERAAINKYTGSWYDDYNMPLNGFDGSYRNFIGLDKVDINNNGCGQEIRDMTRILERSRLEEDMWVRRGVSGKTMSSFFLDEAGTDLTRLSQAELDKFVGVSNRIGSFQSCGTIVGTGFDKPVNLDIFLPKGSEAMYVEPISRCGSGAGISWDGKAPQYSFSREFETIIQRGGSYTCTGIQKNGYGEVTIKLELHPEQGYWKFQQ